LPSDELGGSLAHHRSSLLSLSLSSLCLPGAWKSSDQSSNRILLPWAGSRETFPASFFSLILAAQEAGLQRKRLLLLVVLPPLPLAEGRDDQGGGGEASWSSAGVPLDGSEELLSWEGRRAGLGLRLREEERSAGEPGAISGPEVCRIPAQVCLEISSLALLRAAPALPPAHCSVVSSLLLPSLLQLLAVSVSAVVSEVGEDFSSAKASVSLLKISSSLPPLPPPRSLHWNPLRDNPQRELWFCLSVTHSRQRQEK
jgi:hypothetical protein